MFSPYEILDLSPDATLPEIKNRYRQLVLMYHPDKCRNSVIMSYMSHEYFNKIQEAYKEILKSRRISDMPLEDVEYDSIHVEIDDELRSILHESENFNKKFNSYFEESNKLFSELYYSKGYEEFNHKPQESTERESTERESTEREKTQESTERESTEGDFINGKGLYSLAKKGDYSIKISSKKSLECGDLGEVFGKSLRGGDVECEEAVEVLYEKEKEERDNNQYVIPSKEEAMEQLNSKKFSEEKKYHEEKNYFNVLWEKALVFQKRILGSVEK